ncbi:hypothetical protein PAJ34TS1_51250 [Paenibacillus azoreducens]|uniref:Uncharacterized protein n=1 Tax=Paenibacillus azoreducens TaxID=116718 RepID=A0A919Y9X9_9BACL|nr:hypothetical protein J34TS1_06430 [Paenibacillus azoreducens]
MFFGVGPFFITSAESIIVEPLKLTISFFTLLSGVDDSAIPFNKEVSSGNGGGEFNPPVKIGGV